MPKRRILSSDASSENRRILRSDVSSGNRWIMRSDVSSENRRILRSDVSSGNRRILRSGESHSSGARKKRKTDKRGPVSEGNSGEKMAEFWTRTTRAGEKYISKIYDSTKKKWIWLGTFTTVLEASEAYNAKSKELEAAKSGGVGESESAENEEENALESENYDQFQTKIEPNAEETQEPMEEENTVESESHDRFQTQIELSAEETQEPMKEENAVESENHDEFQTQIEPDAKETQEPMEEVLDSSPDGVRVSDTAESTSDHHVEVSVEKESESDHESRMPQTASENENVAPDQSAAEKGPDEPPRRVTGSPALLEAMQRNMVSVRNAKYRGGGAQGFLVRVRGGQQQFFLPFMDNHGFLLGKFSQVDDSLSLGWS